MPKPVVVVGSLNLDLVVRPGRAPTAGETVLAPELARYPGGKGGNQAVAAARLGVPVALVGRVGSDSFGDELLASLRRDHVSAEAVSRSPSATTGTALIIVEPSGQNRIVVVPGANGELTPTLVEAQAALIRSAAVLLLQFEVPVDSCLRAAEIARSAGVPVVLDPAPAPSQPLPKGLIDNSWLVTPNEAEAAALTGIAIADGATAAAAARALLAMGFARAVVKLGGRGAILADAGGIAQIEPFAVPVVDTTAAGDAFAGGLAAALANGLDLREALEWATAAGALAVTRAGAQPAMGTLAELQALLSTRRDVR